MDAKKKAEIVKPRYLKDTKVYQSLKFIYVGVLAYTFISGYFAYLYFKSHPDRWINTNSLARYYTSQEFLVKEARFLGVLPPKFDTKFNLNKIDKPLPRGSAQDGSY